MKKRRNKIHNIISYLNLRIMTMLLQLKTSNHTILYLKTAAYNITPPTSVPRVNHSCLLPSNTFLIWLAI